VSCSVKLLIFSSKLDTIVRTNMSIMEDTMVIMRNIKVIIMRVIMKDMED